MGPLVCIDCGQTFVITASEKVRFEELMKNIHGFSMPRRCFPCRQRRRPNQVPPVPVAPPPVQVAVQEKPVSRMALLPPPPKSVVEEPVVVPKEEVRLILATKDFEDLVHGQPVVWQGVRVILADIGFKVMREAIDRAEDERAKILFRKNGSN